MSEEITFKNFKEKQNYYKQLYKNRGKTIHVSKVYGRDGKVLQAGSTYTPNAGLFNGRTARKLTGR